MSAPNTTTKTQQTEVYEVEIEYIDREIRRFKSDSCIRLVIDTSLENIFVLIQEFSFFTNFHSFMLRQLRRVSITTKNPVESK